MYTIATQLDEYCKEICHQNNLIHNELDQLKKTMTLVLINNKQIQRDIRESFEKLNGEHKNV